MEFLQAGVAGLAVVGLINNIEAIEHKFSEPHTELLEVTILDLQAKMKSYAISSKKLVEM